MTIRLCLVIPTLDCGGAEKQLCLLAAGLPRDRFDVHVVLLTRDGPRRRLLDEANVPVTVIGKRLKADPTAYFRLRRCLKRLRPDIVHTWLFAANSYGRAAARSLAVPTILGSERCVDLWKTSRHFAIDRYLARRTTGLTTNSQGVIDFYARHGIDAARFHVVPNGIETSPDDAVRRWPNTPEAVGASPAAASAAAGRLDRDAACRRLGVDPGRRLIFAVGRLWPQKRYRDLIWGGEMLGLLRGDTTLVILGDGPQRGELMRYRDAVTNPQRVWFAGPQQDVPELLPHAEAFWIGSAYEGQSNAVMEAMRAAVPVVASDIPGNRDLVVDGQTGILVGLGDAAEFAKVTNGLLEDADRAADYGRAGRARIIEHFSIDDMTQRHVDLYQTLSRRS